MQTETKTFVPHFKSELHGDIDYRKEIKLFLIEKEQYQTKELLIEAGKYNDEDWPPLGKDMNHFANCGGRIPVYSDHDCTGQMCAHYREVQIIEEEKTWIIIQIDSYSFDY